MTTHSSVLVLDDEPHLLDWLVEYLQAKGYATTFATDIAEAMTALRSGVAFRMMILDLNVPAPGEYAEILKSRGSTYENYRGLYVAEKARNMGYRGRQVIVYSVHDIDAVRLVTDRIGATYITKGRPRAFKAELDQVLSFDPSTPKA
jgi:CheY-like chemotaxis protein